MGSAAKFNIVRELWTIACLAGCLLGVFVRRPGIYVNWVGFPDSEREKLNRASATAWGERERKVEERKKDRTYFDTSPSLRRKHKFSLSPSNTHTHTHTHTAAATAIKQLQQATLCKDIHNSRQPRSRAGSKRQKVRDAPQHHGQNYYCYPEGLCEHTGRRGGEVTIRVIKT